jgi:hypothetical protein
VEATEEAVAPVARTSGLVGITHRYLSFRHSVRMSH